MPFTKQNRKKDNKNPSTISENKAMHKPKTEKLKQDYEHSQKKTSKPTTQLRYKHNQHKDTGLRTSKSRYNTVLPTLRSADTDSHRADYRKETLTLAAGDGESYDNIESNIGTVNPTHEHFDNQSSEQSTSELSYEAQIQRDLIYQQMINGFNQDEDCVIGMKGPTYTEGNQPDENNCGIQDSLNIYTATVMPELVLQQNYKPAELRYRHNQHKDTGLRTYKSRYNTVLPTARSADTVSHRAGYRKETLTLAAGDGEYYENVESNIGSGNPSHEHFDNQFSEPSTNGLSYEAQIQRDLIYQQMINGYNQDEDCVIGMKGPTYTEGNQPDQNNCGIQDSLNIDTSTVIPELILQQNYKPGELQYEDNQHSDSHMTHYNYESFGYPVFQPSMHMQSMFQHGNYQFADFKQETNSLTPEFLNEPYSDATTEETIYERSDEQSLNSEEDVIKFPSNSSHEDEQENDENIQHNSFNSQSIEVAGWLQYLYDEVKNSDYQVFDSSFEIPIQEYQQEDYGEYISQYDQNMVPSWQVTDVYAGSYSKHNQPSNHDQQYEMDYLIASKLQEAYNLESGCGLQLVNEAEAASVMDIQYDPDIEYYLGINSGNTQTSSSQIDPIDAVNGDGDGDNYVQNELSSESLNCTETVLSNTSSDENEEWLKWNRIASQEELKLSARVEITNMIRNINPGNKSNPINNKTTKTLRKFTENKSQKPQVKKPTTHTVIKDHNQPGFDLNAFLLDDLAHGFVPLSQANEVHKERYKTSKAPKTKKFASNKKNSK